MQQVHVCPKCRGEGTIIKDLCKTCKGNKVTSKKIDKAIDIPAGIDNGMSIKMSGEGHEIPGGITWDLYISCRVQQDIQWLERKGYDLHYTLQLDPSEVVLGIKKDITFPLIGKRTITIPSGTLDGKIIKLSGDGMKAIEKDRKWDLFLLCKIQVPQKLSKEEKTLYEQIAELKRK